MKVLNIPAYAYFSSSSYRMDMYFISDDAFCKKINDNYPASGYYNVWYESGSTYRNIFERCNQVLGFPLFSPNWRLYQIYNDNSTQPVNSWYAKIMSDLNITLDAVKVTNDYVLPSVTSSIASPNRLVALNMDELGYSDYLVGNIKRNYAFAHGGRGFNSLLQMSTSLTSVSCTLELAIYPETFFKNGVLIDQTTYESDTNIPSPVYVRLLFTYAVDGADLKHITNYTLQVQNYTKRNAYNSLNRLLSNYHVAGSGQTEKELDDTNPYGTDGTSTPGGGDGTLNARGLDEVDPATIPALPSINAADLGFVTMYNPSASDLKSLADFMWSNLFDLDTYKKLFSDPMESIIGLAVVPINPSVGGAKNVMLGSIDSGVNMNFLSTNWASLDCGWCSIEKYIGAFLDADPYTKISLYLPFIGIRQLSADDVNGRMIHVVYHVDVLTGACAAFVEVEGRGVMYTYNGSCITNIPLTSINFSGAIQNAVSAVISGIGTVAGMATGAAPITAMGVAGLMNSAANTALNSKPSVQRSGNLGGSAGIMSIMKPYIIIERPDLSVPYNVQHYAGQTCNMTVNLGEVSGFTMCEYIHVENVSATTEEIQEIEALLKEGVYL